MSRRGSGRAHGSNGATAMRASSARAGGAVIRSKYGLPTVTGVPRAASMASGASVPTRTVKANVTKSTLLTRKSRSREKPGRSPAPARDRSARQASSPPVATSAAVRSPSSAGPTADLVKECTLATAPLRVRNVPISTRRNAATARETFHLRSPPRRSCTISECSNAVATNHGMMEAFSTGSHPQYPPQPSTPYDHQAPSTIPAVSGIQAIIVHRRITRTRSRPHSPVSRLATPYANGTTRPA